MRKNHFLCRIMLIGVFLTTLPSFVSAGPPLQMKKGTMQPATQSPSVEKSQAPKQMAKKYAIAIRKLHMTDNCQVTFKLKNTGSDLTADQHRNSYVKVGHNPRMRLTEIDPGGRLKSAGQGITYGEKDPLTKAANISVEVTLFDGTKTSRQKFFQPKCGTPDTPFSRTEAAGKKGAEGSGMPVLEQRSGSGHGTLGAGIGQQRTAMPKTVLQVKRLSGDLETWDNHGATDTSQQRMDFRWKTDIDAIKTAFWQASLTSGFHNVIASGGIQPIPPKGVYGAFSIDLSRFSGAYAKPATFFVRVKPVELNIGRSSASGDGSGAGTGAEEYEPSHPVRITLTEAGSTPQTEFNLPKVHFKVVFQKILVIDDSDKMDGGDLSFKFTVNDIEKVDSHGDDAYESGDMILYSDMVFIVTDPPNFINILVMGCDTDEYTGTSNAGFTAHNFSDDCGSDSDAASAGRQISTGRSVGRWNMPKTPFSLFARGEKLKFEVHGFYEMYCDPCP